MARGDDDALLLAAAEHVGEAGQDVIDGREADLLHHFVNAFLAFGLIHRAVDFQGFAENAADVHEGRERAEGVLLDVADL